VYPPIFFDDEVCKKIALNIACIFLPILLTKCLRVKSRKIDFDLRLDVVLIARVDSTLLFLALSC
jgi:hypothetical protein